MVEFLSDNRHEGASIRALQSAVLQRRQLGAHFGEMVEIDFRRDDAGTVRELGEYSAPGIDDHRVAVAFEAFGAFADIDRRR